MNYTEISHAAAKTLNKQGVVIACCASNIDPYGVMGCCHITENVCDSWESFKNQFKYYNCSKETGHGITFYKLN